MFFREHHEKTTYDQYGRTFQVFDASRTSADFTHSGVRHVYNARGYSETLQDAAGTEDAQGNFTPGKVYRTVTAMDARGNVVRERLGNGVARSHRFDGETGRVLAIRSGLLTATDRQALAYTWDALGNLKTRTRGTGAPVETFTYDGLNRLTGYALGAQPARAVTYDGYGNIRTKTGTGTYAYGSDAGAAPSGTAGPHAVASVSRPASGGGTTRVSYSYDANGNNVASTDGRTIAYTAFDKPTSIVKGSHTTAFAYAPDRARFQRTDTDAQGTTTTLYLGSVEKITRPGGLTQLKRHIGGVVIETTGPAAGRCTAADATVTQYRLNDHLGSVDALLDEAGSQDQAMRFDPWGRRTDAATGSDLTDMAAMTFDHCATTRGFTNHEMLDEVGVIHMNGRIYDPTLARFLQADPYIQFPNNLQNHNRYSYVMNNPLSYTDPSGHFIFTLSAMIFAAQHGITMTTIAAIGAAGFADALVQGASFEQALQSGFLSGISAAAFSGIGNVLGTHFGGSFAAGLSPTGFGLKVLAHGTVGGITSVLGGGKFGHGFASAGFTALGTSFNNSRHIGRLGFSPLRVAIGAAIGGTASRLTGGKFANGAVSGAFSQALNQEQSEVEFRDRLRQAYDEAVIAADAAKQRIKAAKSGADGTVGIAQADLEAIMLEDALFLQLSGHYRGKSAFRFWQEMEFADGWFFELPQQGVRFRVLDSNAQSDGKFYYGSDINYYYLGFAVASTNRYVLHMESAIEYWNLKQIAEGAPVIHNLRQISIGKAWMREGYRFYQEHSIKP